MIKPFARRLLNDMKAKGLLAVPIHNLPQRHPLWWQDNFMTMIIFMSNKDEDLKHVINEGFSEVADHPGLLREDKVILRHEETVEEGIVRYFYAG